jgi:16S rRNA (guanine527-N7)-methyltransferase
LSDDTTSAFAGYYALLMRWNRKLNLTALPDSESAIDRLLLEPACAAPYLAPLARVLDIGSGGGSPAIPLKLTLPGLELTMVEAKTRKAAFLRDAVRQLGLLQARVEHVRCEELLAHPDARGGYDVVTIRAVRVDHTIIASLQRILAVNGWIMLFHGPERPDWPAAESMRTMLLPATGSELTIIPAASLLGTVPRGTRDGS